MVGVIPQAECSADHADLLLLIAEPNHGKSTPHSPYRSLPSTPADNRHILRILPEDIPILMALVLL